MKKFLIYSGIIVMILLLLYFGISFWLLTSTAARVEARRQAISDAGDKVYLTEYETEPITDEENAYHYLMLAQRDLEAFDADYQTAYEFIDLERRLTPEQVKALEGIVDKYPQLYQRLEQVAACTLYRPKVRYEDGFSMLMEHVTLFRSAARALSTKALVEAYHGEGDAALRQCELSLQVSRHLRHEPMLISHLVHIACQGIAMHDVNHILRVAETSPRARRSLDETLANLDNRQATIDAMKGERALGLLTFEQMRSGKLDPTALDDSSNAFSRLSGSWLGQAYLNDDEAKYIEVLDAQIEALELPPAEREAQMEAMWEDIETSNRFRHVLTKLLAPALNAAANASDRTVAQIRCLRILLALEGNDVSAIEQLKLTDANKIDPYSGDVLLWKQREEGPLIYSVGENGLDDGGEVFKPDGRPLDIGFGPLWEPLPTRADALESEEP